MKMTREWTRIKPPSCVRDVLGRVVAALPQPRPVISCECGDHAFCATSSWAVALVSPQDAGILAKQAITRHPGNFTSYCGLREHGKFVLLHQAILGQQEGKVIDHVNCNGLDNRRANLRHITKSDNARNTNPRRAGRLGVIFHHPSGLWRAYAYHNGKQHSGGYYHCAQDAAVARDALIMELGLTIATLNSAGPR